MLADVKDETTPTQGVSIAKPAKKPRVRKPTAAVNTSRYSDNRRAMDTDQRQRLKTVPF